MSRFSLCLILLLVHSVPTRGHELPDGEIERRVQVSVKPDCVLIEYSLGMNEATLEGELRRLGRKPASTLSDKWSQYNKLVLPSLTKHMQLAIDGKDQPLQPLRAEYSGWSHRHLSCLIKADTKLTPMAMAFVFIDGNFLDAPGKYRLAMKGRRGARLEDSSVPILLSRAKPIELTQLSKKKKRSATRAEATVVLGAIKSSVPRMGKSNSTSN